MVQCKMGSTAEKRNRQKRDLSPTGRSCTGKPSVISGNRNNVVLVDTKNSGIATKSCLSFASLFSSNKNSPGRQSARTATLSEREIDDEESSLLDGAEPAGLVGRWTFDEEEDLGLSPPPSPPSIYASRVAGEDNFFTSQLTEPSDRPSTREATTGKTPDSLLTMPTPKDRSHRKRLQMEREGGGKKSSVYEGEAEPAGYRGQEASPAAPAHKTTADGGVSPHLQLNLSNGSPNILRGTLGAPNMRDFAQRGAKGGAGGDQAVESSLKIVAEKATRSQPSQGSSQRVNSRTSPKLDRPQEELEAIPEGPGSTADSSEFRTVSSTRSSREDAPSFDEGKRSLLKEDDDDVDLTEQDLGFALEAATETPQKSTAFGNAVMKSSSASPFFATHEDNYESDEFRSFHWDEHSDNDSEAILSSERPRTPSSKKTSEQFALSSDSLRKPKLVHMESPIPKPPEPAHRRASPRDRKSQEGNPLSSLLPPSSFPRKAPTDDDTASTQSDEALQEMIPDFLATPSASKKSGSWDNTHKVDSGGKSVATASTASTASSRFPDVENMTLTARTHVAQGEFEPALVIFGQILSIYRKRFGDIHPQVASAYHNLGMVHSQRSALVEEGSLQQRTIRQQSLECFQAAARTARDSLGKDHLNVAVSLVRIGFILLHSKQYQNAIVTFQEALRIRLVHYGNNPHGLVANLYNNLGVCNMRIQNYEEGEKLLHRALDIQRHVLRVERLDCTREELRTRLLEVSDTLMNLGGIHLESLQQKFAQNHVESSEAAFSEALEIRSTVLGEDHSLVLQSRSLLEEVERLSQEAEENNLKYPVSPKDRDPPRPEDPRPISPAVSPRNAPENPRVVMIKSPTNGGHVAERKLSPPGALAGMPSVPPKSEDSHLKPKVSPPDSKMTQIFPKPPVAEIVVDPDPDEGEGEIITVVDRSPERTKIVLCSHRIPRQSSPKKLIPFDNTSLGDGQLAPAVATSSSSVSSGAKDDSFLECKQPYFAEESCIIDSEGGIESFLQNSEKETSLQSENADLNLSSSSHEIVVVRPYELSEVDRESDSFPGEHNPFAGTADDDRGGPERIEIEDCVAPLIAKNHLVTGDTRAELSEEMLDHPERFLPNIHVIASRYLQSNRVPEALHLFLLIHDTQRRLHGELHEDVGGALHNVGLAHLRLDQHRQALDSFETASRIRKGALGRDHPEVAVSLVKVGISLLLLHRFDLALISFREALSVRKRALGALHPSTASIYVNMGVVHFEVGELREARRAFEAALDIQRSALCHDPSSGPLMFGAATTLCNLGYLYRFRDMPEKAVMVLREAAMLQEGVLGPLHQRVISTLDGLAEVQAVSGDCAEALKTYNAVLKRLSSLGCMEGKSGSRAEAVVLCKMSKVHRKQNDLESEIEKLQVALSVAREISVSSPEDAKQKTQLENIVVGDIAIARAELETKQLDWL